jgi:hypothetical protein
VTLPLKTPQGVMIIRVKMRDGLVTDSMKTKNLPPRMPHVAATRKRISQRRARTCDTVV